MSSSHNRASLVKPLTGEVFFFEWPGHGAGPGSVRSRPRSVLPRFAEATARLPMVTAIVSCRRRTYGSAHAEAAGQFIGDAQVGFMRSRTDFIALHSAK